MGLSAPAASVISAGIGLLGSLFGGSKAPKTPDPSPEAWGMKDEDAMFFLDLLRKAQAGDATATQQLQQQLTRYYGSAEQATAAINAAYQNPMEAYTPAEEATMKGASESDLLRQFQASGNNTNDPNNSYASGDRLQGALKTLQGTGDIQRDFINQDKAREDQLRAERIGALSSEVGLNNDPAQLASQQGVIQSTDVAALASALAQSNAAKAYPKGTDAYFRPNETGLISGGGPAGPGSTVGGGVPSAVPPVTPPAGGVTPPVNGTGTGVWGNGGSGGPHIVPVQPISKGIGPRGEQPVIPTAAPVGAAGLAAGGPLAVPASQPATPAPNPTINAATQASAVLSKPPAAQQTIQPVDQTKQPMNAVQSASAWRTMTSKKKKSPFAATTNPTAGSAY